MFWSWNIAIVDGGGTYRINLVVISSGPGSIKSAADSDREPEVHIEMDKSIQTDAFVVYPYEHLFPSVIPQWLSSSSYSTGHHDNKHLKKVWKLL